MPVFRLTDELVFPDPRMASPEGLLAIGGDLSPQRLVLAYQLGIFPWYGETEPILWWSPDPRCVLFPSEVHVSRRLSRTIKQRRFRITCNRAFSKVISACARVRVDSGEGTWLIEEMRAAYLMLHRQGYAHSVEAWEDDELVGGLYGVACGRFFFGESMFHTRTDASKVVLVKLAQYLDREGFHLFDCQVPNPHLFRMGARNIAREDFLNRLAVGGPGAGGVAERVLFPDFL